MGQGGSGCATSADRSHEKNPSQGRSHLMKWLSSLFGGKAMAALGAGTKASEFELTALDGSKFSLQEALNRGPVLLVFFKISCPVCQYALPYYERIYRAYGDQSVTLIGVSQNQKTEAAEFMKRYGITFPVLLD